jgi:hypothetical protein
VIAPSEGVELTLPPGPLEIGFLVVAGACDLPSLDRRLEAGWSPAAGAERVLQAERLQLQVRGE